MLHLNYDTKRDLKGRVGERLQYQETSPICTEYKPTGVIWGTNIKRTYFAKITMKDGYIVRVD